MAILTIKKWGAKITGYFVIKVALTAILILVVWKIPSSAEGGWSLRIIKGAWSFLIPSIIVSVLRFIIISLYNVRHGGERVRGNFVLGINRLTVVINFTLFVIAMMFVFGINPVEFLTGMTIVAMAVAVTFRDYITNMLSGLFIMFSDQLSVGDYVEVDKNRGRIIDITFSSIVLRNDDDDILTVPNNMVFTHPLINLSAHNPHSFVINFELPFETAANTGELEQLLHNRINKNTYPEVENSGSLQVDKIGKDFVRYKLEIVSKSVSDKVHKKIESEVLKQVVQFKNRLVSP